MKLIIIPLVLLISGCIYPDNMTIQKAKYLCKDNGGLYGIHVAMQYPIECNNGVVYSRKILNKTIIEDPNYYPKG